MKVMLQVTEVFRSGGMTEYFRQIDLPPEEVREIRRNLDEVIISLMNGKEMRTYKPIRFIER